MVQAAESQVQKIPWLTVSLILINLAAAIAAFLQPGILDQFAFTPLRPNILTMVSSTFLHGNLIHLLANLVFLASVGPLVEFASGKAKFVVIYLVSGICGVLLHLLMARLSDNFGLLLGASGSIAGCVAFCSLRYMRSRVPILPNIGVPVMAMILIWLVIQVIGAFLSIGSSAGGTSFWAHIGGFLAGLLLSLAFGANRDAKIAYGHEVLDRMNRRGPDAALTAAEHHLKQHPKDVKAWIQKAEAEFDIGHKQEAASAYIAAMEFASQVEELDLMSRLKAMSSIHLIPETQRLKLADRYREEHKDLSLDLYRSVAKARDSIRCPEGLLAVAELTEDPAERASQLRILQQEFPFHPATISAQNKGLLP